MRISDEIRGHALQLFEPEANTVYSIIRLKRQDTLRRCRAGQFWFAEIALRAWQK